ncbi:MAG: dehydratase [Phyllobacteriaceae bacterium]|nr:dehydratase [Phyllobacteriaceae bacterium]
MTHLDLSVDDELAPLELPPISRTQLALFAGASGDHNPIHIDVDFARAAGHADVFAHGMLVMADLGRLRTDAFPIGALRRFSTRFTAITHVHDRLTCRGRVAEILEADGERLARLDLSVTDQSGEQKLAGAATVALPSSKAARDS